MTRDEFLAHCAAAYDSGHTVRVEHGGGSVGNGVDHLRFAQSFRGSSLVPRSSGSSDTIFGVPKTVAYGAGAVALLWFLLR